MVKQRCLEILTGWASHIALNNTWLLDSFSFKRCSLCHGYDEPLAMRMCALRLLSVRLYFTTFFWPPPQPIILYNFILTSVENYLSEELGGDVPSDWLGGLTLVRLHGYYMDLSMNTEQSNPGSSQSFLSRVSDRRRRCLRFLLEMAQKSWAKKCWLLVVSFGVILEHLNFCLHFQRGIFPSSRHRPAPPHSFHLLFFLPVPQGVSLRADLWWWATLVRLIYLFS